MIVSPPRALFEAAQGGNQLADRKRLSLFFLKYVPAVAKRQNARPQLFFDSLKSMAVCAPFVAICRQFGRIY